AQGQDLPLRRRPLHQGAGEPALRGGHSAPRLDRALPGRERPLRRRLPEDALRPLRSRLIRSASLQPCSAAPEAPDSLIPRPPPPHPPPARKKKLFFFGPPQEGVSDPGGSIEEWTKSASPPVIFACTSRTMPTRWPTASSASSWPATGIGWSHWSAR